MGSVLTARSVTDLIRGLVQLGVIIVPIAGLPGWLQAVAHANPLTYAIDAARDLTLGHAAGNTPLITAGLTLALAAAGFTAALPGIRRP